LKKPVSKEDVRAELRRETERFLSGGGEVAEIPYGFFERRIRLPDARVDAGTREMRDGCLILRLRKTGATRDV
jgi:HSP20 family molecular chaperone IbpA